MLDLKNFSCSILVPRCLKQPWVNYSPLRPVETTWEVCKNGQIVIWLNACVLFHMTQLILRSEKKITAGDQINTVSKTNKHRTRWSEHKTAFCVHSQQRNTDALLSASELPDGSARPSDGNSSCNVTQNKYLIFNWQSVTFKPSRRLIEDMCWTHALNVQRRKNVTWCMSLDHTHPPQTGLFQLLTRKHKLFPTAKKHSPGVRTRVHQRGSPTDTRSYWNVESAAAFVYISK